MKQRDTLHMSDIKTGKSRCALYTHKRDNKKHKIDWEKKVILDKEFSLRRENCTDEKNRSYRTQH